MERTEKYFPEINQTQIEWPGGLSYGILDCAKHLYRTDAYGNDGATVQSYLYNYSPGLSRDCQSLMELVNGSRDYLEKQKLNGQIHYIAEYMTKLNKITKCFEEEIRYFLPGDQYFGAKRTSILSMLNQAITKTDQRLR